MEHDFRPEYKKRYDWSQFTKQSSEKYRRVLATGDVHGLEDHNVVRGVDQEIDFIRAISMARFGWMPEGRALDVCCGAGFLSAGLQRAGFEVTGFDLDEAAIRIAKREFPGIRFLCGDAVTPSGLGLEGNFDLIIFREAHPFTRIGDAELHQHLLRDYATLLSTRGIVVIAHARRGGGMHFPSLNFGKLAVFARDLGFRTAGPYFHVLYKRLGLKHGSAVVFSALSLGAALVQRMTGRRLIEFFLLARSTSFKMG